MLAAAAGVSTFLLAVELARVLAERTAVRARSAGGRFIAALRIVLAPIGRAEHTGIDPSPVERRRLSIMLAVAGAVTGGLLMGPVGSLLAAATLSLIGWKLSSSRAARYRRAVDASAASAARALASAVAAGHSVRSSFRVALPELRGPIRIEFAVIARRLEFGDTTVGALQRLRDRVDSRRIELIAAAIAMQQRAGGDLAGVLRSIASTIDAGEQLRDELSAASAQARFTSTIVALMSVGAIVLGELAAPGLTGRVLASPVGVGLLVIALVLQVIGVSAVRRIARVEL